VIALHVMLLQLTMPVVGITLVEMPLIIVALLHIVISYVYLLVEHSTV